MATKNKYNYIKKAGYTGFFLLLTVACSAHKKPIVTATESQTTVNAQINNPDLLVPAALPTVADGIVTLGSDSIWVGEHVLGDTIETVFYFTIQGDKKIKILQVHPGCQCTAPVYPKDSLAPNSIDSIVLIVYTARVHLGNFSKSAYVLNAVKEVDYYILGNLNPLPEGERPRYFRYTNKK